MTTESFMDQIKAFGARLGLPKVDVDKLVDMQLKNIDALGRSAQVAGEGAKAFADKQREIVEAAFKETSSDGARFSSDGGSAGHSCQTEGLREKGVRAHDAEHTRHRRIDQENDERRDGDHSGQIAGELDGVA